MSEMNEMTQEREGAILQAAIDTYGCESQTDMMIEEMSELTKALLKARRAGFHGGLIYDALRCDIVEEMADVYIMLNQMCMIYGDPTDVEIKKLERLESRIARDKTIS